MLGLMLVGFEIALGAAGHRWPGAALRFGAGFVLLVLAANVKIVAAGAACLLAVHVARRCRRPVLVVVAAGAAGLGLTAVVGAATGLGLGWIGALGSTTDVFSWMAPTNQIGFLVGGVGNLFGAQATASAIHVARMLGAVVGAALAVKVLLAVYRGRTEPVRALGILFAVMLLCGPVVHPWYVLWTILPLAAAVRLPRHRTRIAALSAVIALALPPAGSGAAVLIAGYALAVVAACAIGAVWWSRSVRAGGTPAADIRAALPLLRRYTGPLTPQSWTR
jgi:alpha-1,6-mannosyltransferase